MQMIWSDSGRLSLTNAAGSINLERAP
jgi:hypothetical protein